MSIYFDHPWLLLIALLTVPMLVIGWRAMVGMDALRTVIALGMRAALIIALAVMLASPHSAREHHNLTVIGLLDISSSVRRFAELPQSADLNDRSYLQYLRQWFRTATEMKEPDDQFALIVFNGQAAAITTPSTDNNLDDTFAITTMEGTNIADAIQLGLAMFPGDTARRLVLVSDGNETAGNALEAARQAAGSFGSEVQITNEADRQTTIPIDVLPIAYHVDNDVQVVRVEAPPQAQTSQTITVRIVLEATQPTPGKLSLLHEGRYIDLNGSDPGVSMSLTVPKGQSVHRAQVRLLDSRVNRFQAIFEADDPSADALADNNRAEAFTATPAEGKILIVDSAAERRENILAQILTDADFNIDTKPPVYFPDDLLSMQRYDLIVLDNIPAYAITLDQQELLARYVNDLGGGLIMLGGEQSFGAGGWNNTKVEDILPLELDPPRELRLATAALVLVLDRSGSMNSPVAGARASQQQVANEGAALAVESLRETSYVGVVTFDGNAHEHVPLQRNDDPSAIAARIRTIRADGATDIRPALAMAQQMLRGIDVDKKRVVCLSDGRSPTEGLTERVQSMVNDGIQITTIAVGDGADYETLAKIAEIGQGEFYEVRNPRVLPSVLIDSVQIINKPLIKEGPFTPQILAGATSLAAGMQTAPPLQGLVITSPKDSPTITMELTHPDGEPLLAQWQAGLGRVAAFTSSIHLPWGAAWQDWPTAATFWTQLARQTSRPGMEQDAELRTRIEDDRLLVQLNVRAKNSADTSDQSASAQSTLSFLQVDGIVYRPDGSSQKIRLRQTGPEQYTTSIPAQMSGNYIVALTPKRDGQPVAPVIGGTSRTGSLELRRYTSDIALLREIAELTRGRILDFSNPQQLNLFDRSDLPRTRSILPIWRTILLAAMSLLLLDIANRRLAWSASGILAAARRATQRTKDQRERAHEIATAVGTLRDSSPLLGRVKKAEPAEPAQPSADSLPAEVTFSIDVSSPVPAPKKKTRPSKTKRERPDKNTVDAALDALLGRSESSTKPADLEPKSKSPKNTPPDNSEEKVDHDARTSSLLDAKRRAQQRHHDRDN